MGQPLPVSAYDIIEAIHQVFALWIDVEGANPGVEPQVEVVHGHSLASPELKKVGSQGPLKPVDRLG
ncbi:hypothetical protein D3C86_1302540 [compost metagenome]